MIKYETQEVFNTCCGRNIKLTGIYVNIYV